MVVQKTAYANSLKGQFTFGSFTLNASGVDDIKAGLYIYLTNTPEMADAQGNPIQDYVVMAQLNNQNFPIKVGIPFDTKTTNGFISLVTGNVYNATSSHAVGSGYTNVYTMYSSKLTPTLLAAIAKAQIAYKSVPVKPTTPPPTPTTQQPQTPFAAKEDLAPNETQVSQAQGFGGSISTLPPAQKSLSDQQKSAAGSSQTNFGFDMSGGF